MRIVSIQVGKPRTVEFQGKSVTTGIFKDPVEGPVFLGTLNLFGDGQADLSVHGGTDKAVYAFSQDAYPEWRKARPADSLPSGVFGENFTIDHLNESQICVGDRFEIGDALIEAVQPRFPCHKLGVRFGDLSVIRAFTRLERPGIYFRVLREGSIVAGQELISAGSEKIRVSILELLHLAQGGNPDRMREALQLRSLNESWRKKLLSKLANG